MTKQSGGKTPPILSFLKALVPDAPPINPLDWMPAPKSTEGHSRRQYILKDAKTPEEKLLRLARRQWQQLTHGKRIEKVAAENFEKISSDPTAVAKRLMAKFKRRETTEKKQEYRNEAGIADIRRFERLKEIRRSRHPSTVTGKEVGGALSKEDFEFAQKMQKQFDDLDPDFAKFVPDSSPSKKRERRGKRDAKSRNVRDMRRKPTDNARSNKSARKAV